MQSLKHKKVYIYLLINAFLWGISPVVIKLGGVDLKYCTYLFYRFIVVAIFLIPYILFTGNIKKSLKIWLNPLYFFIMLLFNPLSLLLNFAGLYKTTAILSSVATAINPITTAIMGAILLKEKITTSEICGILSAFTGIILLSLVQSPMAEIPVLESLIGMALIILANMAMQYGNILYRKVKDEDKELVTMNSYLTNLPIMLLLVFFFDRDNLIPDFSQTAMILSVSYMGIFGSLIAFTLLVKASSEIEISEASVFTFLQPVFCIPAAILLLKEPFGIKFLIPIVLIVLGMWLSVREKFRKKNVSKI